VVVGFEFECRQLAFEIGFSGFLVDEKNLCLAWRNEDFALFIWCELGALKAEKGQTLDSSDKIMDDRIIGRPKGRRKIRRCAL
jgi:hypothetical protein